MNPIWIGWETPPRPARRRPPGATVRRLRLEGEITVDSALALCGAIGAAKGDTIILEIDSGGGAALGAFMIFEALIKRARRVVVEVIGQASSGAGLVAMAGDRRRTVPEGTFLIHRSAGGPDAEEGAFIDACMVEIFASATGLPRAVVELWHDAEMTFTAEEAVTVGLAHEIVRNERNVGRGARVTRKSVTNGHSRSLTQPI